MSLRMLVLVLPILLACSRSTTSSSSGAAPTAAGENDEAGRKALSQLEDDWAKALMAHDTAFFTRVIAPDFHGTADSGKTFGRAEVIRDAADNQMRDLHDEERQVRIYGGGTVGVVMGYGRWTVEKGERPGQYSGRYTEVFVKRDGRWQAVAGLLGYPATYVAIRGFSRNAPPGRRTGRRSLFPPHALQEATWRIW